MRPSLQKWQKAVCRDVKMGEEELRRFWEAQKGNQITWRILNCRRNNAMNSMKAKFEGGLAGCVCLQMSCVKAN